MKTVKFANGSVFECPVIFRDKVRVGESEYETISLYFDPANVEYDALVEVAQSELALADIEYTDDAALAPVFGEDGVPLRNADNSLVLEASTATDHYDHYIMPLGIGSVDSRLNERQLAFESPILYKLHLGRISDTEQAVAALAGKIASVQHSIAQAGPALPDEVVLGFAGVLREWGAVLASGSALAQDEPFTHEGQVYRAVTAVTPQSHQVPGGKGMLAVYRPVENTHSGTAGDPIPFRQGLACEAGKHYLDGGVLYLCTRDYDGGTGHNPGQLIGHYFNIAEV